MGGQDPRLRTVFLLSVADVFSGIAGVLVCLIVLAGDEQDPRIVEVFDHRATCDGATLAEFRLITGDAAPLTVADWLNGVPADLFSVRWAIRPRTDSLRCYLLARQIAADHNRKLENRGATQAVLSVEYLPQPIAGDAP